MNPATSVVESGPVAAPPESFLARMLSHAAAFPDRAAYVGIGIDGSSRTLSYGKLVTCAASVARRLREGVGANANVLVTGGNIPEIAIALVGVMLADCAAMMVSGSSPPGELRSIATASQAAAIIAPVDAINGLRDKIPVAIPLHSLTGQATGAEPASLDDGRSIRLLLQSSGTTGLPRIVCRSGVSLDSVAHQTCAGIGLTADDQVLATVPLTHSYGIEHGLVAPLYAGATVRLCPGLDLPTIMHELSSNLSTIFPGVPSIFELLAQHVASGKQFPSIRRAYSAGGALPQSVYRALAERINLNVGQLYGATEIGSVTYGGPESNNFNSSSVGKPMLNVRLKLDSRGQLFVRAASMFNGYLNDAANNLIDGFFPTGDLGTIDSHGNLILTGRLKLLIDVGGLKVNPMEIEEVLLSHPAVGMCVVIPMRQTETISRIKAVVTPTDPANPPSVDDLRQFARERLSSYKVPRVIELRASLPRSATGKVLRHLVDAAS